MAIVKNDNCLFCKKDYHFGSQSWQAKPYNKGFCSKECQREFRWKETQKRIEDGQPLIKIFDDYIQCTICGKKMTAASSHFSNTHGFPLHKKMTKLERQAIYGVTKGTRMVAKYHLEEQSQRAFESGFAERGNRFENGNDAGLIQRDLPKVPVSEKQYKSFMEKVVQTERHGSYIRRAQGDKSRKKRLAKTYTCKGCEKDFHSDGFNIPIYCSLECCRKNIDRKNVSAEQRKRMSALMKKIRTEKKWATPRKVTDEEIQLMAELTAAPKNKHGKIPQRIIGEKFGVKQSYVSKIRLSKINTE